MSIKRRIIIPILVLGISILLTSCQIFDKEPVDPSPPDQLLQEADPDLEDDQPSIQPTEQENPLPIPDFVKDYGPAPEIQNDTWLNTPEPLRLADLKGKVVLLEMWTFG